MRKFIHVAVATVALMAATTANTPTAKAGVDECTYAAWQWCQGFQGPNGETMHIGDQGWLECVADAKQYLAECTPPPGTGDIGTWCYYSGFGWVRCG